MILDNSFNVIKSVRPRTILFPSKAFQSCSSPHFQFPPLLSTFLTCPSKVSTGNGLPPSDQHEFNLLSTGETALMTIYQSLQYDLTAYNVTGGQGWILNCLFQEVETQTSKVLFQWSALDHVDPSLSYILPNTTDVSGTGETKDSPWDYL